MPRLNASLLLATLAGMGVAACARPPADPGAVDHPNVARAFGFSKALHPLSFDPEGEAARAGDEFVGESIGCRDCHERVYDNWHASRHRVAFTNPLYKESHAREPSRWCVNCHAPLVRPDDFAAVDSGRISPTRDPARFARSLVQAGDGISCVVCHVRAGKILNGRIPEPAPGETVLAHDYRVVPVMRSAEFCGGCHQFNFLTATSSAPGAGELVYSDHPMQDTLREWRNSSYNKSGGQNCQSCHLFAGTIDSHRFPGGHALGDLARVIDIQARRAGPDKIEVRVLTRGVGHAFPTGDLFRALRVKLYTAGGRPVRELVFKKRFAVLPGETDPHAPAKRLVADDTIPPPVAGEFVSSKTSPVAWPEAKGATLRYEMFMDYLEASNHLVTSLPLERTSPRFKAGRVRILPAGASFVY